MTEKLFTKESDLVAAFVAALDSREREEWTIYHETAEWDLLLVNQNGVQIGIEAKLTLNAKVLDQALPHHSWSAESGPDHRAVLVPFDGLQHHLFNLACHVGITVIRLNYFETHWRETKRIYQFSPRLPDARDLYDRGDWPNWCPARRCPLPDYVPDVVGGKAAPVALTEWKVKAIKLLILLERNGFVTRGDMATLKISPTRWTDNYNGFLARDGSGYVRNGRTPDLKAQHPTNWAEIEADFATWSKGLSQVML